MTELEEYAPFFKLLFFFFPYFHCLLLNGHKSGGVGLYSMVIWYPRLPLVFCGCDSFLIHLFPLDFQKCVLGGHFVFGNRRVK